MYPLLLNSEYSLWRGMQLFSSGNYCLFSQVRSEKEFFSLMKYVSDLYAEILYINVVWFLFQNRDCCPVLE